MKFQFVQRWVSICIRYRSALIAATALITVFMAFQSTKLQIDSDLTDLLPRDLKILQLTEHYGKSKDAGELLVAVEGPDLFSVERLQAFEQAIQRIERHKKVMGSIHPFNMIAFERDGKKLKLVPLGPEGRAPRTEEELQGFRRRLAGNSLANNLILSKDGNALAAVFPVKAAEDHADLLTLAEDAVRPLRAHCRVYITGTPVIMQTTKDALVQDMPKFLAMSALVILVFLFFSFRSLRSIVLPLLVVGIGTLWTTGTMVLLGFKLTVVSIMVPPLVLTLGSSYSIHVLNQYYRETGQDPADRQWIAGAVRLVNPTVFMAALTTIIGFLSLATATLRQIKEFGVATSIGIFYCMVLALFFLPAALSLARNPKPAEQERVTMGLLARSMERLAGWVIRRRYLIVACVGLVAIGFGLSIRHIQYQTNYLAYYRQSEKIIRDSRAMVDKFGGYTNVYLTMEAPEGATAYFLDPEVLGKVSRFEDRLRADPDVAYLLSFTTILRMMNQVSTGSSEAPASRAPVLLAARYLRTIAASPYGKSLEVLPISADYRRLTFMLRVYDSRRNTMILEPQLQQLVRRLERIMDESLAGLPRPVMWGRSLILLYISETLARDQIWSTASSILLIFLVTALGFRSARLGGITLIPLLVGIMLNFILMVLLRIPFDVVTVMFTCVAVGVGVDDSIHLILWYRRSLALFPDPQDHDKALARTMAIAGRPILLTSLTITAGLLVLTFSRFMPVLYFGLLVSMALFTTTIGALIVLPAVQALRPHPSPIGSGGTSRPRRRARRSNPGRA
jgi:hydrophobe/amphiphile efflux-3 (HAE3) family protein